MLLIKTIKDIIENVDLIIKQAEISPILDLVYQISVSNEIKNDHSIIMMGDGIREEFLKLLKLEQQKINKGCGKYLKLAPNIESNDVDLYFTKNVNLISISTDHIRNIIHTTKPINDLVIDRYLAFDRIASNSKKDVFYVSLQCLYSLLTGNCFIPKYLQNFNDFIFAIYSDNHINDHRNNRCKNIFDNFDTSIKIYEKYGYTFNYVKIKTILPCILWNL